MLCAFRDLLSHRSIRRTPFKCRELIRQYPPHFLVNGKLRLTGNDLCLDKHKRKFSANTAAVLAKRLDLDIQFLAEFACKAFKRSFPQLCFPPGNSHRCAQEPSARRQISIFPLRRIIAAVTSLIIPPPIY